MNMLDKIIYIADYIEPLRCEAPHLERIRQLAFSDLNQCVAEILYDTLHYLSGRKGSIDPTTQTTYDFYKQYNCSEPEQLRRKPMQNQLR
jgi:HD superfamily phosphohydrolase YqeK